MSQKIKFINHCNEMPIASLADMVVSASIEPGHSVVSVEAQAMGKPIIASNTGGSKETIKGKSGLYINMTTKRAC